MGIPVIITSVLGTEPPRMLGAEIHYGPFVAHGRRVERVGGYHGDPYVAPYLLLLA